MSKNNRSVKWKKQKPASGVSSDGEGGEVEIEHFGYVGRDNRPIITK